MTSTTKDTYPSTPPGTSELPAGEAWNIFQIMSEFVEGFGCMAGARPSVSIFGSARIAPDHPHYQLTEEIAYALSESGFNVVSGGGPGIMEAANKGAQAGHSTSIGLNISLPHEQTANEFQDLSLNFKHFFARKVMFVKYASAYVVMPGGFGTLDELAEALTLIQTGKSRRIPIILVCEPFWRGLIDWLKDTLVAAGMISPQDLDLIRMIDSPKAIVDAIFDHYQHRGFEPTAEERRKQLNL